MHLPAGLQIVTDSGGLRHFRFDEYFGHEIHISGIGIEIVISIWIGRVFLEGCHHLVVTTSDSFFVLHGVRIGIIGENHILG